MMPTMIRMMPITPIGFIGSECAASAEEVDDQDYNREHEQNVNESAQRVRADKTNRTLAQFFVRRLQINHQIPADPPEPNHRPSADDIEGDFGRRARF